jgi:hypothetical protein
MNGGSGGGPNVSNRNNETSGRSRIILVMGVVAAAVVVGGWLGVTSGGRRNNEASKMNVKAMVKQNAAAQQAGTATVEPSVDDRSKVNASGDDVKNSANKQALKNPEIISRIMASVETKRKYLEDGVASGVFEGSARLTNCYFIDATGEHRDAFLATVFERKGSVSSKDKGDYNAVHLHISATTPNGGAIGYGTDVVLGMMDGEIVASIEQKNRADDKIIKLTEINSLDATNAAALLDEIESILKPAMDGIWKVRTN